LAKADLAKLRRVCDPAREVSDEVVRKIQDLKTTHPVAKHLRNPREAIVIEYELARLASKYLDVRKPAAASHDSIAHGQPLKGPGVQRATDHVDRAQPQPGPRFRESINTRSLKVDVEIGPHCLADADLGELA
jgi:hypothetical protein